MLLALLVGLTLGPRDLKALEASWMCVPPIKVHIRTSLIFLELLYFSFLYPFLHGEKGV